jgi:LysR family transcriptional regulator for metE and metH
VEYVVKIGVAAYHSFYWLPGFLALLKHQHEDIQIEVVASATAQPRHSILQAEVDLVLVPGPFSGPGLESMPLFKDQLILITALGHELANEPWIKAEQLLNEDILTYGRDHYPGFEYERFIRPAQVIPQRVKVIEMVDAIVELVSAEQGVSVLSRWAIEPSLKAQRVSKVQLGPQGLDLFWSCVCRAAEPKYSPTRQVAATLQAWFNQ